jgi:hypothetical protein
VFLDGVVVDTDPPLDRMRKLETLFNRLRDQRRAASASAPPPSQEQWVTVDADVPAPLAVGAMLTGSFAGYSRIRVEGPTGWIAFQHEIPRPPGDAPVVRTRLHLDVGPSRVGLVWESEKACEVVPQDGSVEPASLATELAARCAGMGGVPCVDALTVIFDPALPAPALLDVLARAVRVGPADVLVTPRPRSAESEKPKRTCGAPPPEAPVDRIPPERVQAIVQTQKATYQACYEAARASKPDLAGRVSVRLTILEDGTVEDASLVQNELGEGAGTCIQRALKSLRFPVRSKGGKLTVSYPLVFTP